MNYFDKNPAPFPIHVLPSDLQDVVQVVHAKTQAPIPLIATSMKGAMALACQDLYDVEVKESLRYPISLYQMILAESGERKTFVDRLLMSNIRDLEMEWDSEYQKQLHTHKTDLAIWEVQYNALTKKFQQEIKKGINYEKTIQELRDCKNNKPKEPVCKCVFINDLTKAAFKKKLGTGWPALGMHSDEAGSILSGELLRDPPLLNSLWSGSSIEVDRANVESFKIEDARLSLMLMVQPKLFEANMAKNGEQARASGLYARTLFCEPFSTIGQRTSDKEEWLINKSNPAALEAFSKQVKVLLQKSALRRVTGQPRNVIKFSPEAHARWSAEFNRIESQCAPHGPLVNYRDYASKHSEHVARIAGVIEGFSTGNQYISDNTMYAAIQIANWYLHSFIFIMNKSYIPDEIKCADLLGRWLNENKHFFRNCTFPKNYILKFGPNCIRSKKSLENALITLNQRGVVNLFKIGRTSFVQYVTPNTYSTLV